MYGEDDVAIQGLLAWIFLPVEVDRIKLEDGYIRRAMLIKSALLIGERHRATARSKDRRQPLATAIKLFNGAKYNWLSYRSTTSVVTGRT